MAIFRKSLDKFLAQNNLDVEFLSILASLFVASKRLSIFKFDLVDPNYIFKKRDKLDQEIMFDRGLIPFGECGNGDYLVVDGTSRFGHLTNGLYSISWLRTGAHR